MEIESQVLVNVLMAKVKNLTEESIVKDSVIETLNMQLLQYKSKEAEHIEEEMSREFDVCEEPLEVSE